MKMIIAPDSYKGSLSSEQAAEAISRGVLKAIPEATVIQVPIADGGEGTLDCMIALGAGQKVPVQVSGPLGARLTAAIGLLGDGQTAVIEMAQASGLCLIRSDERDPGTASTFGTGELLRAALDRGCREFILALGGSATNDGGAGMLQALGIRLLDSDGREVGRGGDELGRIATIDTSAFDPRIRESRFTIASDVQNPLVGPEGATYVFGPQKGGAPEQLMRLEQHMIHWADKVEQTTGIRLHDRPGAGAAGGIGGAFLAFFPSTIRRGIDVVIEHTKLREHLADADLVITGEGRIDSQTASGKTPMGIAQEAQKYGVPTIALAGSVGADIQALYAYGIKALFSLADGPMPLEDAIKQADHLLERAAEQMMRLYALGMKHSAR